MHLRLECVGLDAAGDMVRIPGDDPDTIYRLYIGRLATGPLVLFRADVPPDIRAAIRAMPAAALVVERHRVQAILDRHAPSGEVWNGKSYTFPSTLSAALYPDVRFVRQKSEYAVIVDDRVVSACSSTREDPWAGEAWVHTDPAYRGRGFARQATAAWAHALQQRGKIPFYSHLNANMASQGVARSLGLIQYTEDTAYA